MDYEKKYNEALKWMRELYPGLHGVTKEDAERYFPELRESEDERIRKEIVGVIQKHYPNTPESYRWISWLEKQKPAEWSEVELEFRGEKVKVKRPFYRDDKGRGYSTAELDEEVAWNALRAWCEKKGISIYDLYPKAEWGEEDEDMLNCCISSIEEAKENRYAYKETDGDTSYDREIAFLKSLRPSWKPSDQDELMKLKYAGTSAKLD